ncbi:MAG: 16S rRNA (uracil(1498)-N(3))-methyltransferase [Xanthomonadaceae bacterium]|nr:16S rRNA (uracil(1498)-N(3))-methyltransferase [Xanthomonadaceae bacterium]MDE2244604.1 16S rRNA (uracil(1498)-N(3))-methyltransferase [Xanthomonadaceae bacterium]
MRSIRLHVDLPLVPDSDVTLPAAAAEHATRVLRLRSGDALVLFNGDGHDYPAHLLAVSRAGASVRIATRDAPAAPESPLTLTLAQGIARGEKMDLILQKATELGVTRIVPLITARTEVRLDAGRGEKRMTHWRGVIAGACEQCGRARLPELATPRSLAEWTAASDALDGLRLCLDPEAACGPRQLPAFAAACLVVGPEGGLAPADHALLQKAGFTGMRLGPRVLRTETAGLATLAALQALHGDF